MSKTIDRAFLLAAGLGTRLRPLTNQVPKCLVPVSGKPLLSIWVDLCERMGIAEVLINTHHLADQVRRWAEKHRGRVRIKLVHEDVLLGSAGTVSANRDFVAGGQSFFIFYADNLVEADLSALESVHAQHRGVMTIALFHAARPHECGIATLDESGCLIGFEEKPSQPRSDLANAGIYLARRDLFSYLPAGGFCDFGKDILPRLVGNAWGYLLDGYLLDVGTPESYQRAQMDWPALSRTAPKASRNSTLGIGGIKAG